MVANAPSLDQPTRTSFTATMQEAETMTTHTEELRRELAELTVQLERAAGRLKSIVDRLDRYEEADDGK